MPPLRQMLTGGRGGDAPDGRGLLGSEVWSNIHVAHRTLLLEAQTFQLGRRLSMRVIESEVADNNWYRQGNHKDTGCGAK